MMHATDRLLSSRTVRDRLGGVSDMTIWRWVSAGILPAATKINGRNFWPESVIQKLASEGSKLAQVAV
jgi:predicted DNA-binding transcriptional regulator AlpA